MNTPQQKLILNYLEDGDWHCMANADFYMKDDRKRISELNAKGYVIQGSKCDGRCGKKHTSPVLMRRLVERPPKNQYQLLHERMQLL